MAASTISALLEGSASRGFMAVAEARTLAAASARAAPVRGFMTLSISLGSMLVCVHAGLLHAVAHEQSSTSLAVVLRTLCVLLSAAPYERLPQQLLPDALSALRARWTGLQSGPSALSLHPSEAAQLQAAYLACIAEAMSTKQPHAGTVIITAVVIVVVIIIIIIIIRRMDARPTV